MSARACLCTGVISCLALGCAVPEDSDAQDVTSSQIKVVFVIAMENHGSSQIYGNATHAPYLQSLVTHYGHATAFADELPQLDSEPHYVWMEAGTNAFADTTFTGDGDPSTANSTASTAHLSSQIDAAHASWRSYQEDLSALTGACPIASFGHYAAKHDPFVFFRDVVGATPSKTNAYCAAHHKPLTALAGDLASGTVAAYNFITPDLCHDMHANLCAGWLDPVKQGDTWLAANVPAILDYATAHAGVVLIVWDEPAGTTGTIPLIVAGPHVKANHASAVAYTHSSLVKSVEHVLGLPTLATVTGANELTDFFDAGYYP
jgi:hypothetical protein